MALAKSTLTCPDIKGFSHYREFLRTFWNVNQEQSFFSSRYLASKLNWSSSYFHDVLAGRKQFTYKKALELANFISLSDKDSEYLFWLVISDSPHELSSSFALKKLKTLK